MEILHYEVNVGIVYSITSKIVIVLGYSEWMGRLMKSMYEAKLALLKIELQVLLLFVACL